MPGAPARGRLTSECNQLQPYQGVSWVGNRSRRTTTMHLTVSALFLACASMVMPKTEAAYVHIGVNRSTPELPLEVCAVQLLSRFCLAFAFSDDC